MIDLTPLQEYADDIEAVTARLTESAQKLESSDFTRHLTVTRNMKNAAVVMSALHESLTEYIQNAEELAKSLG